MEQKVEIDPLEIIANQLEDEDYTVPESAGNVNNGENKPVPNVNKSKKEKDAACDDHEETIHAHQVI